MWVSQVQSFWRTRSSFVSNVLPLGVSWIIGFSACDPSMVGLAGEFAARMGSWVSELSSPVDDIDYRVEVSVEVPSLDWSSSSRQSPFSIFWQSVIEDFKESMFNVDVSEISRK